MSGLIGELFSVFFVTEAWIEQCFHVGMMAAA